MFANPVHALGQRRHSRPGVPPFPLTGLVALMPWYAARLRAGDVLRFSRLPEGLPPEASAEREYCRRTGFRSHLMIPFMVGGPVLGGIGFGTFGREVDWPDALVARMRLVGEVFANALARKVALSPRGVGEESLPALQARAADLTPRERQVMGLVASGMPNKRSATVLGVGEKTIKAHRARVMRKMRADSLPALVRMADRLGIGT